jgi:sec-independent protein translocase protein TatB
MDFLSPPKLLMILVIALIVLGPDKLPSTARRIGALWNDVKRWRSHLESEVRGAFPDLPSSTEIARAVRSPISMLDRLADEHGATPDNAPSTPTTPALDPVPTSVATSADSPPALAPSSHVPRDHSVPDVDLALQADAASMN